MFWTVFLAALLANVVATGLMLGAMVLLGPQVAALYKPAINAMEKEKDAEAEREAHERELAQKVRNIR